MNRFSFSKLILLAAIITVGSFGARAQVTNYTSAGTYTYTIPAGVTLIGIDMAGGQGGTGGYGAPGGMGGRLQCNLTVTPLSTITINVGGAGNNSPGCCSIVSGGYNGGGYGAAYGGGGGGGATDIRMGGTGYNNRVCVAGGGGGASSYCSDNGANAGGASGDNGTFCGGYSSGACGAGGTQSYGGAGAYYGSSDGGWGYGGNAYNYCYGGGGGAGYYGGGGGYYGSAGGGSSYPLSGTTTGVVSLCTNTGAYQSGNGYAKITVLAPTLAATPSSLSFGTWVVGTTSTPQSFTLSGSYMTAGPVTITAPSGFLINIPPSTTYTTSATLAYTAPTLPPTTINVEFAPSSYSAYSSNISITGGGLAATFLEPVSGIGNFVCSGTPVAGTAAAFPTSAGAVTPITLSLSGTSTSGGLTYQWQSSQYPTFGFTNIPGANSATYTQTGITANTYFRCVVTCSGSSLSSTTNAVMVTWLLSAASCTAGYSNSSASCGTYNMTTRINITGAAGTSINDNAIPCNGTGYLDETSSTSLKLNMGATYSMTSYTGPTYGHYVQVWIDFNGDGSFATTESVGGTSTSFTNSTVFNIIIPSTGVTTGIKRMRVVGIYNGDGYNYPNINPCTPGYSYGETRDYYVAIQGPACSGVPVPGTVAADVAASCSAYTANVLYTETSTSSGLVYQWQSSTTSATAGFTNIAGATSVYYSPTVTATRWVQLVETCASSGGTAATTPVQLSLNPPPAAITGNTAVCTAVPSFLTSASTGGTWVSSNPSVASVGLGTGVVSGLTPGIATVSYTLPTGCFTTAPVSVNTSPGTVTGPGNVCVGTVVTLADVTTGGTWSSGNTSFATVSSASGAVTGMGAGSTNITYTAANGCYSFLPVNVNPLPAAITGGGNVCVGGTTSYTDPTSGGFWSSTNSFQASVGATSGIVTGIALGSPNIVYRLPTGCKVSAPVTVNPLPSPISGAPAVCLGQSATLTDVSVGGAWATSDPSIATIDAITGIVTGTTGGSVSVIYTLPTSCAVAAPLTVNLLPTAFNVTGGGGYCSGGVGVHVGLNSSTSDINYTLYYNTDSFTTVEGSSAGLDFGLMTGIGTYTVVGVDALTGCSNSMASAANVSINPLPHAYNVTGGGAYCSGDTGVHITTDGSDIGVNYRLYMGSTAIGGPVGGTGAGAGVDFGPQTASGIYTAVATDGLTLCSADLGSAAEVDISPVPRQFNVGGGGPYCIGLGSDTVTLDNSDPGIAYKLYLGTAAVDSTFGTTLPIVFRSVTGAGMYTIVAHDITNNCNSPMIGNATVTANPLPGLVSITGGGNYCDGGNGEHIGLNYSAAGTHYQLLLDGTPVGSSVAGATAGLDFGLQTSAGSYTAVGTIDATGCAATMLGSATIIINPLPRAQNVTGGGGYCAGSGGSIVTLDNSEGSGINYQLYRDGVPAGALVAGTGSLLSFGLEPIAGTYTARAINGLTGCSNNMTGSTVVSINPLPAVYNVTGGGSYCAGGTGVVISIDNSASGTSYQVYNGSTRVGPLVPGTGAAATLIASETIPGVYTVVATDNTTGCSQLMRYEVIVGINPAPAVYSVTGGGHYCAGSTGVHVGIALTSRGVSYELLNSGTAVSTYAGTGASLDFGIETASGAYTIIATDNTTGCTDTMSGSANVVTDTLPTVYTVTGGGQLCAGDAGVNAGVSYGNTGISYLLYNSGTYLRSVAGADAALSYGLITAGGAYTVVAKNPATGCTQNMSSSAYVVVNPLPTVYTVSGGGNYCAGGAGEHILLNGSDVAGINYQVFAGSTADGPTYAGTGLALDLGAHLPAGTYHVVANNPLTTCSSNMAGTVAISITAAVTPSVTITSASGNDTVCAGAANTFTAVAANGGSAPVYQWSVNSVVAAASGSAYRYTPAPGDNVSVTITSNAACATPATASNTMLVSVLANLTPAVSITADPGATICPGAPVTLTAAPVNGGTAPAYTWKLNGATVGTAAGSYTYTPGNNDVLFAILHSNYTCLAANAVFSNNIVMDVNAPAVPAFTIAANPGTSVMAHEPVTFTAMVTSPAVTTGLHYQWKVNGSNVGTNSATYTASDLANYSVVACDITNSNDCGTSSPAIQDVTIQVNSLGINQMANTSDIKVIPNPNKGNFTIKGSLATKVSGAVTLEVTNMVGQVVYRSEVNAQNGVVNEQVQIGNNLPNGMYILNLRSGSENTVFHFVIEE